MSRLSWRLFRRYGNVVFAFGLRYVLWLVECLYMATRRQAWFDHLAVGCTSVRDTYCHATALWTACLGRWPHRATALLVFHASISTEQSYCMRHKCPSWRVWDLPAPCSILSSIPEKSYSCMYIYFSSSCAPYNFDTWLDYNSAAATEHTRTLTSDPLARFATTKSNK